MDGRRGGGERMRKNDTAKKKSVREREKKKNDTSV
jgi:hypothetical protein